MNEDFMTSSEKLECFLDGELSATQASELFAELAINPKLQQEMQMLMKMKDSFKSSYSKVPDHLKTGIMLKTGLENPTFINQIKAGAGFAAAFWALLTGKVAYVTYSILIALGIGFYFYNDYKTNNFDDKIEYSSNKINPIENKIDSEPKNSIAKIESTEEVSAITKDFEGFLANEKHRNYSSKKNKINSNQINLNTSNNLSTDNLNNNTKMNIYSNYLFNSNIVNQINNFNSSKNLNIENLNNLSSIYGFDFLQNLTLHFKNFNGISSVENRVNDLNSTILNNISIGLMYNISKNFSIGIEGGLENFNLKFQGYENDILMNYYQNYNAVWGGLAMQYTFNPIFEMIELEPYLRGLMAINELGPVFKLGAGAKYYISSNVALSAGIESGWFIYENNSKYFNTNKTGYSIGFVFGF